jgi:diguanylate cyclase (GGDEF)-like protein
MPPFPVVAPILPTRIQKLVEVCKRRYTALLKELLPSHVSAASEEADTVVQLANLALLATLFVPCFVAHYLYFDLWNLAIALMFASVLMIGAPWIYQKTGSIAVAREGFLVSLFGYTFGESIFFSGVISPSSAWFVTMPIIAILLGSIRSGIAWLVISVSAFLGLYYWFDNNVIFIAQPSSSFEAIYTFSLIFLTVALVAFVLMVDASRKKVLRRLKDANAIVRELAIRDSLTGVYNRRYVWEEIGHEERRAMKDATSFFIFLIDLDNFKRINDTFGHVAGDLVLEVTARAIQSIVREGDCFGRYGGEEFILLAKGDASRDPEAFAERIRQHVSLLMFNDVPGLERVTVSIGITEFHRGENFTSTISRADSALYAAKKAGRNLVRRALSNGEIIPD